MVQRMICAPVAYDRRIRHVPHTTYLLILHASLPHRCHESDCARPLPMDRGDPAKLRPYHAGGCAEGRCRGDRGGLHRLSAAAHPGPGGFAAAQRHARLALLQFDDGDVGAFQDGNNRRVSGSRSPTFLSLARLIDPMPSRSRTAPDIIARYERAVITSHALRKRNPVDRQHQIEQAHKEIAVPLLDVTIPAHN